MYERSAIVLERYFGNLLGYSKKCNICDNFENYCDLVAKLEKYQINYQKEVAVTQEFNKSLRKVKAIQAAQENLYKRSVQLEYNRNLLFNNIEGKVEDTRKCIEKIESDVDKNNEEMKRKKEELLEALEEYNTQRFELSKCKRYKKMAENDYNEVLEKSQSNFEGITSEVIETVRDFSNFDSEGELLQILEENGEGEKIPFNEDVMKNATQFSVDNTQKLAQCYLVVYDKMQKLLSDISDGAARVDLHKKYARNEKAKVDFLLAAKDYLVQFLDYERMTVIYGRKSHNRLMSEACENFGADVVQINNLYELLLKEIANKATKKAYKELYNKSYLIDIQDKEEKFKKEKNRVNLNTATLLNSNYWRIEGIQNIYTIFYKTVSEVFEKDITEFDLPKVVEETSEEPLEVEEKETEEVEEEVKEVVKAKIPFEINSYNDEEDDDYSEYENAINEIDEDEDEEKDEEETDDESDENDEFDIFGEKYQEIDIAEVAKNLGLNIEDAPEESIFKINEEDDENDDEDEDLFVNIKSTRKKKTNDIEDFDLTKEESGKNVLRKIRKISSVKKKKTENDIW